MWWEQGSPAPENTGQSSSQTHEVWKFLESCLYRALGATGVGVRGRGRRELGPLKVGGGHLTTFLVMEAGGSPAQVTRLKDSAGHSLDFKDTP